MVFSFGLDSIRSMALSLKNLIRAAKATKSSEPVTARCDATTAGIEYQVDDIRRPAEPAVSFQVDPEFSKDILLVRKKNSDVLSFS